MILEGPIRLAFTYAAGEIGSRFLVALRDRGVILGARCGTCDRVICPPRSHCAMCGGVIEDLVEVGPGGTVEAWTEMPDKGVFGMILLEGADTALVHRLLGATGRWERGTQVTARFADVRIASITDIEGFEMSRGAS